jgi:ATP-binding protein involved in chromosome partitioning
MSEQLGIKLLSRITQICHASDCGNPLILNEDLVEVYRNIAEGVESLIPKD